jgi:hypothetical protein
MELRTFRLPVLTLIAVALAVALLWSEGGALIDRQGASALESSALPVRLDPSTSVVAAGLQPGLDRAVAAAMSAATAEGYALSITSGYRTADEQERLLAEAIDRYGSEDEALRWVFEPERSMHVQGFAVDMGDRRAAAWLEDHGASFGLCRTLSWEWWHFEWRGVWEASGTCPAPVDDPADAPGI